MLSLPSRRDATHGARHESLAQALHGLSYEVLPFPSTEENVLAHVPRDVALTITSTEARGLEPTVRLAERLSNRGYTVAPHVAARLVRDRAELEGIVARLDAAGVDGVFVIGGDAAEPRGEFPDALALLDALKALGHRFRRIGIAGYPEGHGRLGTERVEQALNRKRSHATHVVTQMCFDVDTTVSWARRVAAEGVDLPIRLGIPGPVSRQKLVRISASLGLGQSARFLKSQHAMIWRLLQPGGYSPKRLIAGLAPSIAASSTNVQGFHVFTFNELARTEAWRQAWLDRLASSSPRVTRAV